MKKPLPLRRYSVQVKYDFHLRRSCDGQASSSIPRSEAKLLLLGFGGKLPIKIFILIYS